MKYALDENKELIRISEDTYLENSYIIKQAGLNLKESDLDNILLKISSDNLIPTIEFYEEYKNSKIVYGVQFVILDNSDGKRKTVSRSFILKGNENVSWFEKKINSVLKSLDRKSQFQNLAKIIGTAMNGWDAYSTSFGFSVWTITRRSSDVKKDIETIENVLKKYDIKYSNEMSKAGWVFRFVLNKDRENMEKIKMIKKGDF